MTPQAVFEFASAALVAIAALLLLTALTALSACSDGNVRGARPGGAGTFAQAGTGGVGGAVDAQIPQAGTTGGSGTSGTSDAAIDAADAEPTIDDAAAADGGIDAALEIDASLPPPPPPLLSFDPPSGTFGTTPPSVTLAPYPTTLSLYYTVDGSYPSKASTPYTTAIAVTNTTLLRVAIYDGDTLISVRSASYVQLGADVQTFSSHLPLVIVHMLSTAAPNLFADVLVPGISQLHDRDANSGIATLTSAATVDSRMGIKIHGRSTRFQAKNSYSVEYRNQMDEDDEQTKLLDLPAQSDYVLYAPYNWDRSFVRDAFWYALSRSAGRYAPRTRFVEVFYADNNAAVDMSKYLGVYVLTEKIKRDKNRVDIASLAMTDTTEPTITGGYIVKFDDPDTGDTTFDVPGGPSKVVMSYPEGPDLSQQSLQYITDYMNATGRAFGASDHKDPTTMKTVMDLVDVDAFIDHHIFTVMAKNPDGFRLSTYMFKDRNGKLNAGPLWDCDRCMGSYDGRDADPTGWNPQNDSQVFTTGWWPGLFSDKTIQTAYKARWTDVLAGPLSVSAMDGIIDPMVTELTTETTSVCASPKTTCSAADRNNTRWTDVPPKDGIYLHEIDTLKTWLHTRQQWITDNVGMLFP